MTTVNNLYYCVNHDTDEYALGVRSKSGKVYVLVMGVVRADIASLNGTNVCGTVGTDWATPPPVPRSILYGYDSGSGWISSWSWVK